MPKKPRRFEVELTVVDLLCFALGLVVLAGVVGVKDTAVFLGIVAVAGVLAAMVSATVVDALTDPFDVEEANVEDEDEDDHTDRKE